MIRSVPAAYEKEVFLVLPATMKYEDLKWAIDSCRSIEREFSVVFTKMDETHTIGNVYDAVRHAGRPVPYMMNGPRVPVDLVEFDAKKYLCWFITGQE